MQTDRFSFKDRSSQKNKGLKLRTENEDLKMKTQYCEKMSEKCYFEQDNKTKKTSKLAKIAKISLTDLQSLVE